MYWIHWGVTTTDIMSAHMSHVGEERLSIKVFEPQGLAIDFSDQLPYRKLVWSDIIPHGRGRVEKEDLVLVISTIHAFYS